MSETMALSFEVAADIIYDTDKRRWLSLRVFLKNFPQDYSSQRILLLVLMPQGSRQLLY